ncbi:GNAT family N-acetyltransferase [Candidatus Dojkabacteria bacterium]|nr:GNAT family N-acetyltransferase [Candidatus Dojkabacteria bacterium]
MDNIMFRKLKKADLPQIWTDIDRSESVDSVYVNIDEGIKLKKVNFEAKGWPPGEVEKYQPILTNCFDRGGYFLGGFVGQKMIAVVILDQKFIGKNEDTLQLKFLHIGRTYRKKGLGGKLFRIAAKEARRLGAKKLYVSATENMNTVDFYKHMGCTLAKDINKELYKLEPNDIHLEYKL